MQKVVFGNLQSFVLKTQGRVFSFLLPPPFRPFSVLRSPSSFLFPLSSFLLLPSYLLVLNTIRSTMLYLGLATLLVVFYFFVSLFNEKYCSGVDSVVKFGGGPTVWVRIL